MHHEIAVGRTSSISRTVCPAVALCIVSAAPSSAHASLALAAASSGSSAGWPAEDWSTASPRDMDMDEALLAEARDYALSGGGSGMIVRSGQLVFSWGDLSLRYHLKSTTKSIGVTALGLAIADGLVGLDDAAQTYLPTVGVPPESNASTGWLDDISLIQLATHSAGFDKPGGFVELLFEPGTAWSYSDGGPNWLADVLTVAYGTDLYDVMQSRVFIPIGIDEDDLTWRRNAHRDRTIQGIERREFGSGIRADVDAMARLGYLYLRDGVWEDRRILPAAFVDSVGRPVSAIAGLPVRSQDHAPSSSGHYGLLWWNNGDGTLENVPSDAFWSWGLSDSLIVVIPSMDIVAVRAGDGWRPGWNSDYSVVEPFIDPIARSVLVVPANERPEVVIHMPEDGINVIAGDSVDFAGSATDAEDGDLTPALDWQSDLDGMIGLGGAFATATLSVGPHVVTASVTDSGALTNSASIRLGVIEPSENTAPMVSISSPVDGTKATEGDAILFIGMANDAEEGDLTAALEWGSNLDGMIGTGGSFSATALSSGGHVVTASVADSEGWFGSSAVEITVTAASQDEPPPAGDPGDDAGGSGGGAVNLLVLAIWAVKVARRRMAHMDHPRRPG